jgi:hypothetical protein
MNMDNSPHGPVAIAMPRLIPFLVALCLAARGQTSPPADGLDLGNPILQSHASLRWNSTTGNPLDIEFGPAIEQHHQLAIVTQDEPDTTFTMAHLQTLTCNADVIVIGKVHIISPSHYNAAKNGIYRDIDFDPSVVLRDNPKAPLRNTQHMVVTGLGGTMPIGSGFISYQDSGRPQLRANATYILFLRYIPETNGYVGFDLFGTLELTEVSQWVFSRQAYRRQIFPELVDAVLRTAISKAVCR